MMQLTLNRLLKIKKASAKGRPKHLAAASGLLRMGGRYYVVADDELHLGSFPATGKAPGILIRVFPGKLPAKVKPRKKRKPDLEALVALPDSKAPILLAVPSGSRPNRKFGATPSGRIDFSSLYRAIAQRIPGKLNIEGACVRGNELVLAQRGNSAHGRNALIVLDLAKVLKGVVEHQEVPQKALKSIKFYDLGTLRGVPLTFTDLAALPNGKLVFSAAAEDTEDPFDDAPFTGSVIGLLSARGKILQTEPVSPVLKVEGIHVEQGAAVVRVWCVTDADDPNKPAGLYEGELRSRGRIQAKKRKRPTKS